MKKICIVSPLCYPILSGSKNIESAGGSQTQVILIAKELMAQGWNVIFLVGDYGQKNEFEIIDQFEVHKVFTILKRPKIYQFVKNYISLKRILKKINPDICFTRGEIGYLWPIINVCKSAGIKTVYSTAHVTDCMRGSFSDGRSKINRKLYELSIDRVDRESNVIYNGRYSPDQPIDNNNSDYFLWVGSIIERKQPEVFIKLAKMLPNLKFVMIGGTYNKNRSFIDKIRDTAKEINNLEYRGFIRDDFHKSFYSNVIALINTSKNNAEGFPNTFIESWSYSKPVISLFVDPDNIIKKYKLGYVSGSFNQLVKDVQKLNATSEFRTLGNNAKEYFQSKHDIRNNIVKYNKIFNELSSN